MNLGNQTAGNGDSAMGDFSVRCVVLLIGTYIYFSMVGVIVSEHTRNQCDPAAPKGGCEKWANVCPKDTSFLRRTCVTFDA